MQCEAISRRTNERCPHPHRWVLPNTLAHGVLTTEYAGQHQFRQWCVSGRHIHLCDGHARSWHARKKRGLTLRLIDSGWLSAFNSHRYGSIVLHREHVDWQRVKKLVVARAWCRRDDCEISGPVPPAVFARLGLCLTLEFGGIHG